MISKNLKSLKVVSVFVLIGGVAAVPLPAQTTSFSDIVGYQSQTIPVGPSAIGITLLNPDILKSTVSSVSSNAVSISGQTNIGAQLTAGEPYYLEVYSGSLKGDRFEVNTDATRTAGNGTVLLNSSSANNTFAVASIGTNLNSQTVALRKHITLSQIQGMFSPALVGNNNPGLADSILLFSGGAFVSYALRGDNVKWQKSGDPTDYAKLAVPPGTGIMLSKRGSSTVLTESGAVRRNDFALPLASGLQFVAPSVPLDRSPVQLGMIPGTNGWFGTNNSGLADALLLFSTNQAFVTYSLRADGQILRSGDVTDFRSNNLLPSSSAYFIRRRNANADLVENQIVP